VACGEVQVELTNDTWYEAAIPLLADKLAGKDLFFEGQELEHECTDLGNNHAPTSGGLACVCDFHAQLASIHAISTHDSFEVIEV